MVIDFIVFDETFEYSYFLLIEEENDEYSLKKRRILLIMCIELSLFRVDSHPFIKDGVRIQREGRV